MAWGQDCSASLWSLPESWQVGGSPEALGAPEPRGHHQKALCRALSAQLLALAAAPPARTPDCMARAESPEEKPSLECPEHPGPSMAASPALGVLPGNLQAVCPGTRRGVAWPSWKALSSCTAPASRQSIQGLLTRSSACGQRMEKRREACLVQGLVLSANQPELASGTPGQHLAVQGQECPHWEPAPSRGGGCPAPARARESPASQGARLLPESTSVAQAQGPLAHPRSVCERLITWGQN